MIIVNYKDIKISSFYLLVVKLWLKEMIVYTQIISDTVSNSFIQMCKLPSK